MPSLTAQQVKAAKPAGRPQKLFDGQGMYLFVSPTGAKVFRLQYRIGGRQQQTSLGAWPEVSLAEARDRAQDLRRRLRAGEDIRRPRKAAVPSFRAAAEAYWQGRGDISDGYRRNALRGFAMHVYPTIGATPVTEVTRDQLLEALRRVDAAGRHVYARRLRMWAGLVFAYAGEHYGCGNPAAEIRPKVAFGAAPVVHHHAVGLAEVGDLLARLSLERTQSARALRLLALTWLRTTELRTMEWADVVGDRILLPAGRMKRGLDHLVPLSRQALAVLEAQRGITGGLRYVWIDERRADRPMSENAMLYLLHRMGYRGRMTGHGWRSIGSTWANEAEYRADVIERQLAHVPGDKVRAAYNRAEFMPQRARMLQAWADWLAAQESQALSAQASSGAILGSAVPA